MADQDPSPTNPEQEKVPLEDVRYMIVDDDDYVRESTQRLLEARFGMNRSLASVGSVREALERVEELIEHGERLDLVILDRQFFLDTEHRAYDTDAGLRFVEQFEALKEGLQGEQRALADRIRIIMASASVKRDDLKTLQVMSPAVLGVLDNDTKLLHRMVGMLGRAGIVHENEHVLKGKELLSE